MTSSADTAITWDIDIPLVTNPRMLGAMLKVTLGSAGLVAALVSLMLVAQGAWDVIPSLLGLFAAVGVGFFVLSLMIMLVVFGNRFRTRFVVDGDSARYYTRDRMAKTGNRAALVLGLLLGRPGAAGTGLLAMSQEQQALQWGGAFRAEVDAARCTIALRNRWRTLMMVYCTPQNFEAVRALVVARMAAYHTADRAADGQSPVGAYLGRTVLAVLACVPLFLLAPVYGHGLFLPLLLMCFAIATVWFVRHLAWVVLGSAAVLVVTMLSGALASRGPSSFSGASYRRYETLPGDDWALTGLAALGLAYLVWQALRTLRRRVVPALESDMLDGAGQ